MKSLFLSAALSISIGLPVTAQTVGHGFLLEELAEVNNPSGLALSRGGGGFASGLLVATRGETPSDPDLVLHVDVVDGDATLLCSLLPTADPVALEFPPAGSPFGNLLYVSSNNRDFGFGGSLDCGGVIQTVDAAGNWSDFTGLVGDLCSCSSPAPESSGLGEPLGLDFGSGAFGDYLFVGNSTDAPADVMRVDPAGSTTSFVNDNLFSCLGDLGMLILDVEFGPGGAFGTSLYVTDRNSDIRAVDPAGVVSAQITALPVPARELRFGRGGRFGFDLYAAAQGTLYRVKPDGSFTVFATGFDSIAIDGLEFSPRGDELYVSDAVGDKVYRIRAPRGLLDFPFVAPL